MYGDLQSILDEKGTKVISVSPQATVQQASEIMAENRVGALLVVEHGTPVGIFSERDLMVRVVAQGKNPLNLKVCEVMTRDFFVVRPDVDVREAMAIVTEKRCRHLPVVEDGNVLGIVSSGDLTKWVAQDSMVEIQHLVNYITGKYPS